MGNRISSVTSQSVAIQIENNLLALFPEFFINENRKLARILARITDFFVSPELYVPVLEQIEERLKSATHDIPPAIEQENIHKIQIKDASWPILSTKPIKPSYYWWLEHFLSTIEREEHFNQNAEHHNSAPTLLGMLPYNVADELLANGVLWNDDKLYGRQLLHGQKTHRLQMALLALAIKSEIVDTEGLSLREIVQCLLKIKFNGQPVGWDLFFDFDNNKTPFHALRGKNSLGDPYFLNYLLVTSNTLFPYLSSIIQYQFYKTVFDVQKVLAMQGEQYSPEDIIEYIKKNEKTPLPADNNVSVRCIINFYEESKRGRFDSANRQLFFKEKHIYEAETIVPNLVYK